MTKPRIYIAAASQHEAGVVANIAKTLGYRIQCRWLTEEGFGTPKTDLERTGIALLDLRDIDKADVLISLATADNVPGGKHVELGYALAQGLKVVHLGRPENVFHYHPGVQRVSTTTELKLVLGLIKGTL